MPASKYEPLAMYLKSQSFNAIPMTFEEVERVLGFALPPVAKSARAWWSNNPSNNVMTKVWTNAGFKSEQVDMEAERLIFRRVDAAPSSSDSSKPRSTRSALFGCLKGSIQLAQGVDLTAPTEAEWDGAGQ